ncbi:trigger factor [Edaphobacillus lindanitolerans]|uniref:Trigger factor n=1 Tax=Edaphobacillus lindanitolerans TaxID=550447 RepID=A0A1U7PMS3_9BACI|nr:trigger factor [Edaphobacillus lindanitolerans]SIT83474.1 trigger factor [Edaphobacillus lindanitolerans]
MTVNWEKQEGNQGVLTVEVPAEKVKEGIDKAFKKVVKQVNVPGFRKGKVPRKMFENMFGVESLYQDAVDEILPEAYSNAIEEAGIDPVDRPEIEIEQIEQGQPMIFKATVTVKPEVKLGDYKGIEVERQDTEVTDEEIEEQLNDRRQANVEFVIKEDEPAAKGDTVVIDFEGFSDGEAFEGGKAEGYELEIGSGSFIPGFEEQLEGVKAGEEKEVEVTFPEEYHAAELAGKPATFKVTVHEVKSPEVPELDDELAKEIDSEVETLDELRSKLKERTASEKKDAAEVALRDELVETAAKNAEIDIPEVMVESEVDRMVQEFGQRLQQQGMTLDLYFQFSGQDEAALRAQMHDDAEMRVRVSLVLEAIANAENIEVNEEDVQEELKTMSEQFGMDTEQIKSVLGGTDMLENDIRFKKTIEFLVDNASIKE